MADGAWKLDGEQMSQIVGRPIPSAAQLPGTWAGGTTRAIAAVPPEGIGGPAQARLWVGTAVIERSAPYSHFAGRTRLQIPVRGNGIRLRFREPDEIIELGTFAQHQFSGARPTHVELLDGPILALNLIAEAAATLQTQVSHVSAQPIALPIAGPAGALRVLYVAAGALVLNTARGEALTLHEDAALVLADHAPAGLTVAAPAIEGAVLISATLWG